MSEAIDMGLYDSDTGLSLEPVHVENVTAFQDADKLVQLVYTKAKRGPIVQLRRETGMRIHYFYREPSSRAMIEEDTKRFGFKPSELLSLVDRFAPEPEPELQKRA